MILGWNEIKERAVRFSKEWKDAFNEEADVKQFLIEFFNVFGIYNPLTIPPDLVKAHNGLDKAVDLAYRPQPFANETKRIEYLFELCDKYTAGLFATEKNSSAGNNRNVTADFYSNTNVFLNYSGF